MFWSPVLVFGLVQLCASKAVKRWDDFSVKHSWAEVPRGWVLHGSPSADHTLEMRIGLKQDKIDELISALYEVSDPTHERYGVHLSKEEVDALVAPHPETTDLVEAWLTHHGVDASSIQRSGAGEWISLRIPIAQAERMLDAKYDVYYNPETEAYVVRTLGYSLPSALTDHVDVVAPTTYFGNMHKMKTTSFLQPEVTPLDHDIEIEVTPGGLASIPSSCSSTITPSCLKALYNTTSYTPKAKNGTNQIGIVGYLEEYASNSDLQTFFKKFLTSAEGFTFETTLVNGGKNVQSNPGGEANLDAQYSIAMSYPTPNTYYSVGGSPPYIPDSQTTSDTNEPYLDWLNYILNQTTIPQTFSTSYGDDEQTVPLDYATSVCNLFAQLGARGSSVMFASGDDGVGGGDCESNNGTNIVAFQPNFPASCPYVTTVGGTYKVKEVAVDFSGGGFSNYFAQPSYQSAAVSTFLSSLGTTYKGLYNASGRGYPDVAAQAQGFQVVVSGSAQSIAGTSCASPTFAGVVALLNDYRISNGKSPLGFLNPLFYSTAASGFNDITSGSNPGCGTNGFTARTGWDPVTGLGTPNFLKLQPLVLNTVPVAVQ